MSNGNSFSIGQIVKRYQLSRSTIIYYEKIRLLVPSFRTVSGYRQYSSKDLKRLESILLYRSTGIPLEQIKRLIEQRCGNTSFSLILEDRLSQINADIDGLRVQQKVLIELLHKNSEASVTTTMSKEIWSDMLASAGLDEQGMLEWHRQFEKRAPIEHHKFLASLGLEAKEIKTIREKAGQMNSTNTNSY